MLPCCRTGSSALATGLPCFRRQEGCCLSLLKMMFILSLKITTFKWCLEHLQLFCSYEEANMEIKLTCLEWISIKDGKTWVLCCHEDTELPKPRANCLLVYSRWGLDFLLLAAESSLTDIPPSKGIPVTLCPRRREESPGISGSCHQSEDLLVGSFFSCLATLGHFVVFIPLL